MPQTREKRAMCKLGILVILPGLLFGVHSFPSSTIKRHHVAGRSSAQLQLSELNLQKHDLVTSQQEHHHREPRDIHMLRLHDPLDCLSQIVCGMNTYPPQKPSVRSSTANDFAFLLKNAVSKLRTNKSPTTTTTVPPATKRTSTTKAPLDDDDDNSEEEEDNDYEADEVDDYYDDDQKSVGFLGRRAKKYSIFSKRRGDVKQKSKQKKTTKKGKSTGKKMKGKKNQKQSFKKFQPKPLSALDKLRMETDLRAKLLSDAQCINGLQDHSCPFNYQQMLVLISTSLERERTISYSSSKVLPMVGYLIKSRNYTGTLQATFMAIERINNYTIENDRDNKAIDFTHILDEVMNRQTGDTGLRIVDTSNDSASASVWEDDEFDHVLQHPYERKRPQSDNYKLAKKPKEVKKKQKVSEQAADDDQSTTSEEDTSEEGLVFDRRRPPPGGPNGPGDGDSSSEEDEVNQENKGPETVKEEKAKKKITGTGFGKQSQLPGPVFGFSHLQKSAEEE